jgi:hypothetical protein
MLAFQKLLAFVMSMQKCPSSTTRGNWLTLQGEARTLDIKIHKRETMRWNTTPNTRKKRMMVVDAAFVLKMLVLLLASVGLALADTTDDSQQHRRERAVAAPVSWEDAQNKLKATADSVYEQLSSREFHRTFQWTGAFVNDANSDLYKKVSLPASIKPYRLRLFHRDAVTDSINLGGEMGDGNSFVVQYQLQKPYVNYTSTYITNYRYRDGPDAWKGAPENFQTLQNQVTFMLQFMTVILVDGDSVIVAGPTGQLVGHRDLAREKIEFSAETIQSASPKGFQRTFFFTVMTMMLSTVAIV